MVTIFPDSFIYLNRCAVSHCWNVEEKAGSYRGWWIKEFHEAVAFAATIAAQHGVCSLLIDREA